MFRTKLKRILALTLAFSMILSATAFAASSKSKTQNNMFFGRYEQDGNLLNGAEPIEWIVVMNDGTKAMLMSKYILDNVPYLHDYANVPWETSDLRSWMNGTFYASAFTDQEKAMILDTYNQNPDSTQFYGVGLPGGNPTNDKVFALSVYEAQMLFGAAPEAVQDWNAKMQAQTTPYAQLKGCWTHPRSRRGFWWLRSPGTSYGIWASTVQDHGGVIGHVGNQAGEGARPVIWVRLQ
ncbi:MAG: DUF6273 domain-containing protein [Lachnospiraceae bacterium]|nr:DUF6273 domain-containing protein [Lachnospiraceae bacterium]